MNFLGLRGAFPDSIIAGRKGTNPSPTRHKDTKLVSSPGAPGRTASLVPLCLTGHLFPGRARANRIHRFRTFHRFPFVRARGDELLLTTHTSLGTHSFARDQQSSRYSVLSWGRIREAPSAGRTTALVIIVAYLLHLSRTILSLPGEHDSPLRGVGQLDWPGGDQAGAMRLPNISRTRHEDINLLAKLFEVRNSARNPLTRQGHNPGEIHFVKISCNGAGCGV